MGIFTPALTQLANPFRLYLYFGTTYTAIDGGLKNPVAVWAREQYGNIAEAKTA